MIVKYLKIGRGEDGLDLTIVFKATAFKRELFLSVFLLRCLFFYCNFYFDNVLLISFSRYFRINFVLRCFLRNLICIATDYFFSK